MRLNSNTKTFAVMIATALILLTGPTSTRAATPSTSIYFPPGTGDWVTVDPASVGWDAAQLDAALDYAGAQKSSGVVILHNGKIMAERHWPKDPKPTNAQGQSNSYYYMHQGQLANGHSLEDVASAQKSFVSTLVGIAQHKGLLKLNDPANKHLGAGWSNASAVQEDKITIRHLITMSSGLTLGLKHEKEPGTKWFYNTPVYGMSLRAVATASSMNNNELTGAWLTNRIGMGDSNWQPRPWASDHAKANAVGFVTTARDLARFGLLIQAGGDWDRQTIIADKDFLRESLQPSQKMNPRYGYLWWLNQPYRTNKERTQMIPAAPDDLVAARGALGRKLYVVPSLGLVVTRLGDQPEKAFSNEFWKRIMAAAPNN